MTIMGMAASQARFLALTARKSNVEYEAQRINFERLQLAEKSSAVSQKYNDSMSNRKLTFSFNTGEQINTVDVTYTNYKNYMNHQMEGLSTTLPQMFLVSSSGNKIIVSSEDEITEMIESNTNPDGTKKFDKSNFMIVEDLDKVENFQKAIEDGVYYFATYGIPEGEEEPRFTTLEWENLGAGAISEEYDKTDDAEAQAEYDSAQDRIQSLDKKLELKLNKLETERNAIQTEMESVQKVIEDNVESSFKTFS